MTKSEKLNSFLYSVKSYDLYKDKITGDYCIMIDEDKANVKLAEEYALIYGYFVYRTARGYKVVTDMKRI